MLTGRIIQLGGTPVTTPQDWYKWTNCGYDVPDDPFVRKILEQNIKGEQSAIGVYQKLLQTTLTSDPVTYNIVLQILEQEAEHEEDLQSLLDYRPGPRGRRGPQSHPSENEDIASSRDSWSSRSPQ